MTPEQLRNRTKAFALAAIRLVRTFPRTTDGYVVGRQFLRAATSVAANYRAACRARSRAEFFSKLCNVVEEVDESVLWLELITESDLIPAARTLSIQKEAVELRAILAASRRTMRGYVTGN
jgi:four helix bundle protein